MDKNTGKSPSDRLSHVMKYLPAPVTDRILGTLSDMGASGADVNELRLRAGGRGLLVVNGRNIPIELRTGSEELGEVLKRICDGAVFAHRDDISKGYVTLGMGVRVGVCGHARYDCGRIVGVSDISTLVFRRPSGECSFAHSLYRQWKGYGGGMLICSAAGEGKTTAIRALARLIGSGSDARRVVVVDERSEFSDDDYRTSSVDILSGYKRALGVEIAVRTLSAEVIIVDEISSREDAAAMLSSLGAGVCVIATVHARSLDDAMKRDYVRNLIKGGLFECVCLISRSGGRFSFSLEPIDERRLKSIHGTGDICHI